jgi:hypothetical protein
MTEREELEYAAKAGCYLPKDFINNKNYMDGFLEKWNPREDDCDCARLEAALEIDIAWYDDFVQAQKEVVVKGYEFTLEKIIYYKDFNNDKQKARKHAVTRLAAEIGKAMQK